MLAYRCVYYMLFFVGVFLSTKPAWAGIFGLFMILVSLLMRSMRKDIANYIKTKSELSYEEKFWKGQV